MDAAVESIAVRNAWTCDVANDHAACIDDEPINQNTLYAYVEL